MLEKEVPGMKFLKFNFQCSVVKVVLIFKFNGRIHKLFIKILIPGTRRLPNNIFT